MSEMRRTATRIALLAFVGAIGAPVGAQERTDATPLPRFADDIRRWIDESPGDLLEDLKSNGVYLRAGSFASGTGVAPGVDYWHPSIAGGAGFMGSAARSLRGDTLFQARFGTLPGPARALRLRSGQHSLERLAPFRGRELGEHAFFAYVEFTYRELASSRLSAPATGTVRFGSEDSAYDAVVGYAFSERLAVSARAGRYTSRVVSLTPSPDLSGSDLRAAGLTGFGQRLDFARLGAELAFDTRDVPGNPHAGTFLALSWYRYDDEGSSTRHSFDRLSADARRFVPLGSDRNVLALRLTGSRASASADGVPVQMQEALGGSRMLRSYPGERFRGDEIVSASVEYRFEVDPRMELAAFYDLGGVWGGLAELEGPGWRSAYGAGIRLKSHSGVLLRLDLARGDEGSRAHVSLGYSF
jgi:Omp85 superfamily domain